MLAFRDLFPPDEYGDELPSPIDVWLTEARLLDGPRVRLMIVEADRSIQDNLLDWQSVEPAKVEVLNVLRDGGYVAEGEWEHVQPDPRGHEEPLPECSRRFVFKGVPAA